MTEELKELCKDYVNWVMVMQNGGGYTAEVNRTKIHEKIHELSNITGDILYHITSRLDEEVGLPVDVSHLGAGSWKMMINKCGLKLYERLLEEIKKGNTYPKGGK